MDSPSSKQGSSKDDDRISILMLNDDCLYHILSFLELRELLIAEKVCVRFNDVAQMIYRTCRELNLLKNLGPTMEVREIISRVGQYLHTLRISIDIYLSTCTARIQDSRIFLEIIRRHCKNLQNIELRRFCCKETSITDLAAICKDVKQAFMSLKVYGVDPDTVVESIFQLNQLKCLEFTSYHLKGSFLSSLSNIRELNLSMAENMDRQLFIKFCEEHPHLQSLNIEYSRWINKACLQSIVTNLTQLEKIAISDITNDYIVLTDLPKINYLTVSPTFTIWQCSILVEILRKLHDRLEYLHIKNVCPLANNGEVMVALGNFTRLKELTVKVAENFTDTTLDRLLCTATLQQLKIPTTNITGPGLERLIARCPAIKLIDASERSKIDETCIPPILSHLKGRSHMLELKVNYYKFSTVIAERKFIGNNPFKLKISNKTLCEMWEENTK